jgi:hypothetical protein
VTNRKSEDEALESCLQTDIDAHDEHRLYITMVQCAKQPTLR